MSPAMSLLAASVITVVLTSYFPPDPTTMGKNANDLHPTCQCQCITQGSSVALFLTIITTIMILHNIVITIAMFYRYPIQHPFDRQRRLMLMRGGLFLQMMVPTLFWTWCKIMGWRVSMLDAILGSDVFGYCHSLIYWLTFENPLPVDEW